MKSFVFSLFLFSFVFVNGQEISTWDSLLTSKNVQRWVLDSTSVHLGNSVCTNGIVMTFLLKDKKVLKKTCAEGQWKDVTLTWKVEKQGHDFLIHFSDGTSLIADYVKSGGVEFLRLRGMVNPDKSIPFADHYFRKD